MYRPVARAPEKSISSSESYVPLSSVRLSKLGAMTPVSGLQFSAECCGIIFLDGGVVPSLYGSLIRRT